MVQIFQKFDCFCKCAQQICRVSLLEKTVCCLCILASANRQDFTTTIVLEERMGKTAKLKHDFGRILITIIFLSHM